jgi:hypothetical protein
MPISSNTINAAAKNTTPDIAPDQIGEFFFGAG